MHNLDRSRLHKLGGMSALTCTSLVVSDDAWIAEGMVQKVVGLHGALAHSTRLRIGWVLSREREVTPNEFADMLGKSQQNVSKHLKTLARRESSQVARTAVARCTRCATARPWGSSTPRRSLSSGSCAK
jgi:hypothetical protein